MTHPNEELIRRLYEARARGDQAAIREMFDSRVRWHKPYPPPYGGELEGVDALFEGPFRAYREELDELRLELHDVVANDRHAIALVRWRAVREGRSMDGREIAVHHVEGGRVTEVWFMAEDEAAAIDFFS